MKHSISIERLLPLLAAVVLISGVCLAADTACLVRDADVGPGTKHAVAKLREALAARGLNLTEATSWPAVTDEPPIVAGLATGGGTAAAIHAELNIPRPDKAESLLVRRVKYKAADTLLVSGADDRSLMYALLDLADRIGWADKDEPALAHVRDVEESPEVVERALSIYTMNKAVFESFFYDEKYWAKYLDMMAANRFNTFALLFGYENAGYFSPPYPQFFEVDEFPDIKVIGVTKERQQRNIAALRRIIKMTHDRGMNFTLGIWDHIYRGGVQGPNSRAEAPTPDVIWGLDADNLHAYTKAGLTEFLRTFPEIDAIQFRMHGESGLKRSEMDSFWTMIYRVMLDEAPHMRFDARAKNFPHHLIDKALDMGVDMRICTKYWMEQMGMPFHPTHVNKQNQHDRRHGYADMLRYPKRYDMHWRLWNSGTTRVLQWGDPDYVRRFVDSTHLYDGQGFEVSEPMTTKMQDHPHDDPVFDLLTDEYRYYTWEFERYWHFHQLFGRLGYNPDTPSEIWHREFQNRFGPEAAPYIEKAMHEASKILPRIVSYCHPYYHFPTTRGWAEKQRQGDLPDYAKVEGTDTQQFLSPDDAARCVLENTDSAKIWPQESAAWFADVSKSVLENVTRAEKNIGSRKSKEFTSTMTDMRILAHLSAYHSHRSNAGFWYAVFKRSDNPAALDQAISHETLAVESWKKIVDSAADVFTFDMKMGRRSAGLSGHWRDELTALQAGLEKIKKEREGLTNARGTKLPIVRPSVRAEAPILQHKRIERTPADKPLKISAHVTDSSGVKWVRVLFRQVNQFLDYKTLEMKRTGDGNYEATVPAEEISPGWDFMYLFEVMDNDGNGRIYPDLEVEAPYIVVKVQR